MLAALEPSVAGIEEQAALEAEGIAVEVVPGVTAALGCAASIGLAVTQRGQNRSLTLLTASGEDGLVEHDWAALAKPGQALAIYMGVGAAPAIAEKLLAHGMDAATPVSVVENGTLTNEKSITTTLPRLGQDLVDANISGPAIIYVGLAKAQVAADVLPFRARGEESQRAAS